MVTNCCQHNQNLKHYHSAIVVVQCTLYIICAVKISNTSGGGHAVEPVPQNDIILAFFGQKRSVTNVRRKGRTVGIELR